jgi:preprotein translocase subunit SecA
VLHDGAIAEMKTGEGKTLVSPLAGLLQQLRLYCCNKKGFL